MPTMCGLKVLYCYRGNTPKSRLSRSIKKKGLEQMNRKRVPAEIVTVKKKNCMKLLHLKQGTKFYSVYKVN